MLAEAVLSGAASNGHQIDLVDLADVVRAPLRDCRTCRLSDGRCGIDDEYEELLRGKVADADVWIFATPLYWYGIAGQLKIFIDRLFCYTSSGNPDFADMIDRLKGKRFAVALTAEESYPGAVVGATAQLQELARYLRHEFVGVVRGVANSRGEVQRDPAKPMDQAYALGARLFDGIVSDYRVDSERSGMIWPTGAA